VLSLDDYDPLEIISEEPLISARAVCKYMMGASIGAKFGTLFRKVNFSEEGNILFACAYSSVTQDATRSRIKAHSPTTVEQLQAQLGACYRLRDIDERTHWLGNNDDYRLVQETVEFFEDVFIVDKIMNHMLART